MARRVAFVAWVWLVIAVIGVGFFGLTVLVLGWFEGDKGAIVPVTDLGYGALIGILITGGFLAQVASPGRKIAGAQQAALGGLAILASVPLAADSQNIAPGLITLGAVALLVALHPARGEFFRLGRGISPALAAVAVLGSVPLIGYALSMAAQARELSGPPHHTLRLTTMAAMAMAVPSVGLLAALRTRGWRVPAWCASAAAIVFGLASVVFSNYRGSAGRAWGGLAIGMGVLFVLVAEWTARRLRGGVSWERRAPSARSASL